MIPMTKKVGRAVRGVKTGCHAGRRCCRKAPSTIKLLKLMLLHGRIEEKETLPVGFLLFFLSNSSVSDIGLSRLCTIREQKEEKAR